MGKKHDHRGRTKKSAAREAKAAARDARSAGRDARTAARPAKAVRAGAAHDPERMAKHRRRHAPKRPRLNGISEIRAFLRTNQTPIHFISPTPFNLLGIDRWVRDFYFIGYYDCFEGSHPRVFVPHERPYREFQSIEEINAYLLGHKEVGDFIRSKGDGGLATFLMFDEAVEELAPELGLRIIHPSAALRHHVDSKTVTTRLGNEAGIPSAPNVLGAVRSYRELLDRARAGGLGEDLVVQAPYGDSGQDHLLHPRRARLEEGREGGRRRAGGQDHAPAQLPVDGDRGHDHPPRHDRRTADDRAHRVPRADPVQGWLVRQRHVAGGPLRAPPPEGAQVRPGARRPARPRGLPRLFEVDVLADVDDGELYLGEINPRISGVTSMTNATAGAYADLPLFAFHLLEYMDVDYEIDVDDINHRWAQAQSVDVWSQLIVKEPDDRVELLTEVPRTGIWRIDPATGGIRFGRWGNDWHSIVDDEEAFFLRVLAPATTATRAPTSACSSRSRGCRPTTSG